MRPVGAGGAWETHRVTGEGVRIAIEDDPVDVLLEEFRGRVATRGAGYTYVLFPSEAYESWRNGELTEEQWRAADWCASITDQRCKEFKVSTAEEGERAVRREIERTGRYPVGGREVWFVGVENASILGAWRYVPSPREKDPSGAFIRTHGTRVASTAAGTRYGVAPGAEIVPSALTLGENSWYDAGFRQFSDNLFQTIFRDSGILSSSFIREFDDDLAQNVREYYANADVINQSYAIPSWSNRNLRNQVTDRARFWGRIDEHLPATASALRQLGVRETDKTFVVTAAGNDSDWAGDRTLPAPTAVRAVFYPELRGLAFAVAALAPNGRIAEYSNLCGWLPSSGRGAWDPRSHGRHYCLTAPGTVNASDVGRDDGSVYPVRGVSGTSFAAPIVSGGLALMKERFRGQLTPREIGLRMVNTANNRGVYADYRTYGAGVLDLEAAMNPVGATTTGAPGRTALSARTQVATPAAWGDVGGRVGGTEFASFDEWNAPFWSDLGSRFTAFGGNGWAPPEPGDGGVTEQELLAPHLAWSAVPPDDEPWFGKEQEWRFTFGARKAGRHALDTFGLSTKAFGSPLRFGLVYEGRTNQGAEPSGAFGERASSALAFVSREHGADLGDGPFSLEASWMIGAGRADYPDHAMLQAGGSLYSAGETALVHEGGGARTRLAVSQPLRAESGTGTLTFPVGRTLEGEWLYRSRRFDLAPEGRELRLSLRHDRSLGRKGAVALEVGRRVDAGHTPGREANFAGMGYGLRW